VSVAADLDQAGHRPWLSVTLAGLGPREGATAASEAYRLCSTEIAGDTGGSLDPDRLLSCLTRLPGTISERVDLQRGTTDLGPISLAILHGVAPPAADGWTDLWDFLSVQQPASSWQLSTGVSDSATAWTLVSSTGLTVGDTLHIGSETVLVTVIGGGGAITVVRGMYGTTARAHDPSPDGDGTLYDRPRFLRGRRVEVTLNLIDPSASSDLVYPPVQEIAVWTGLVDDWSMTTPGEVQLSCRSTLARLDRTILRQQWTGVAHIPVDWRVVDHDTGRLLSGIEALPMPITVEIPDGAQLRLPDAVPSADPGGEGWVRRYYARIGDCLCECECWTETETDSTEGRHLIVATALLETDDSQIWEGEELQIAQVWPLAKSPDPRGYLDGRDPLQPFTISGDSTGTEHPAVVMRMLLNSTGEASNGVYDVLPEELGLGIPVAELDADSWNEIAWSTSGLRFPGLILGWDMEPVRVREWLEREMLGPLGWWLYLTVDGTIGLGRLEDVYPGETLTVIDRVLYDQGVQLSGRLQDTISLQTWRYGWDWKADRFLRARLVTTNAARDRLVEDDSEAAFECAGIAIGESVGETTIGARTASIGRWWASPQPVLSLSVPLGRVDDIAVGTLVELDGLTWPCPYTGGDDWTGVAGLVTSRSVTLDPPGLGLTLQPLPDAVRGLWAPSATVVSHVGNTAITVEHDDYTEHTDGDAGRFQAGQLVALYDYTGVPRCDVAATIDSIAGDVITLVAAFSSGGAPVAPAAGDIITYPRWSGGAAPAGSWDSDMDDCVAQADGTASPPQLPDGSDPYTYGS